ncbi:cupredoxin domain-containing protein [Alteromonas mediterranea]|uniref:cupredoxin domain-containing protein n=1 Tax=Alteromonas mediterranea TaxID=314275 RepID=UPI002FE14F65
MIWINITGLGLIALIVWWFWLYKTDSTQIHDGTVKIRVKDGIYQPANISIPVNQPAQLIFLREDPTPCAESLLIPDLNVSETLSLNKPVTINLPGTPAGTYPFHCQMQMYRGTLVVK